MPQPNAAPSGAGATLGTISQGTTPWDTALNGELSGLNQELANLEGVSEVYCYHWADATAQSSEVTMRNGDFGYRVDQDILYRYLNGQWRTFFARNQTWTPAPTSSGGTFTEGSGNAYQCVYSVTDYVASLLFRLTFGTSPSVSSGTLIVSMPSGINLKTGSAGTGFVRRANGTNPVMLLARCPDATRIELDVLRVDSDGHLAPSSYDYTAQASDFLTFTITGQLNY